MRVSLLAVLLLSACSSSSDSSCPASGESCATSQCCEGLVCGGDKLCHEGGTNPDSNPLAPDAHKFPDMRPMPDSTPPPDTCSGMTLSMVSGDGAYAITNNWEHAMLRAKVTSCGAPVVGTDVVWTLTNPQNEYASLMLDPNNGTTSGTTVTQPTDADGISSVYFRDSANMSNPSVGHNAASVTAGGQTVSYHVTICNSCVIQGCNQGVYDPDVSLVDFDSHDFGTVHVGDIVTGVLKVHVSDHTGFTPGAAIPNIGVRLTERIEYQQLPPFPNSTIAHCVGGTVLTDSSGNATRDVHFDAPVAAGANMMVLVGEERYWFLNETVLP